MHQLTECQLGNVQRKTSVEVYHNATLFAGVENILDTQYRTFSSGINAREEIYMGDFDTTFKRVFNK
jgi:ABC-type polysaccharide/polyol phosphate transport system ATPase subunit